MTEPAMVKPSFNKEDIVAREARFVTHVKGSRDTPDVHIVKEMVHLKDGRVLPNLHYIKDFERPFWITNVQKRSHKQKKETEIFANLMQYKSTETDLAFKVADALGVQGRGDMRKLGNSPYLYGTEIPSTSIIMNAYQRKNTSHITNYSVMSFDIETDMVNGTEEPIITTASIGDELFLAATSDFVKGLATPEESFLACCRKYITEFEDISKYKITYVQAGSTVDLIRKTFAWIHERKPDLLAIWNMDFDIPKIIDTLGRYGIDPASILCDPSIHPSLRVCRYKQGQTKRKKSNGQEVPIPPADRWHTLFLTASFYVIDAMCTYRLLRLTNAKEQSYSLDSILDKELGARKLKFKEADAYKKGKWHWFMQSNYKAEYMAYALFDSLSMTLLDAKTRDLLNKLPGYAGITHFSRCNSKPKMIGDKLHYYCLENGHVPNAVGESESGSYDKDNRNVTGDTETFATTPESGGDDDEDDDNPATLSLRAWIMTLPAHLVMPGLDLLEEGQILTKLRGFVFDSDAVSAYPSATSILNVSKSTTKREIIDIEGIDEMVFRLQNINLSSGYVNALEYGHEMFGLPMLRDLPGMTDDLIGTATPSGETLADVGHEPSKAMETSEQTPAYQVETFPSVV